jgi:membrane AbrB-like protein
MTRVPAIWLALALAALGGGLALGAAGLPSPYLFSALLAGLVVALSAPESVSVPPHAFRAGQAVAGVSLGAYLQSSALSALADSWLPVLLVSAATLALSLGAGGALTRFTSLDAPTASLGLIAGGASGIVGMSDELGADDRLVAFMQYVRVLVVVILTPLLTALAFPGTHGGKVANAAPLIGTAGHWALTVALAAGGVLAAHLLRVTAGALLGPMVLTGIVVLAVPGGAFQVPELLRETAFATIGLQIGLRFTMETIRLLGRLLVPVVLSIAGLLVACFGLAVILNATTSASLLDSYLATTPGGLYAVLALAFGAGANTTFVIAVQSLRVFVMVLIAPLAVRWAIKRFPGKPARRA